MKKTVIIGCIHKELNVLYDRLPQANEEGSPLSVSSAAGGSGYETALLYQKIGFPYELLAGYGSGIYAEETKAEAAKEGISAKETDVTAGCGYHMFDKSGNESLLTIPGGEYDFPADSAYELDSSDCRNPIVFGEMLTGSDPENVLSFLYDLGEPYTFVPSHCWSEIDVFLREEILRMKPCLHLSMSETEEFLSGEYTDPLECAKEIYALSEAPVVLIINGKGSLCYDGKNSF
jgi:sugar/nucleoside kinase (ribokinase family)